MAPVKNPRIVFKKIPEGYPIPGEHTVYDDSRTIDLDTVPLNGGYLTKTLVLSPEPYMRERLRDPKIPSYSTPMKLGYAIVGFAVVKVLRSEDPNVKAGDYMCGITSWEAYSVQPYEGFVPFNPQDWPPFTADIDGIVLRKVEKHPAIPWTTFLNSFGSPGQTAWMGIEDNGGLNAGETIFVSTGAGALGIFLVQLAKLKGLKVIASTGSDAKVDYLKNELGVDHVFNYNTTSVDDVLREHGPLNVYWDNVGGKMLESAIQHSTLNARIIICGAIPEYNNPTGEHYGVKNLSLFFKKRLRMTGILLTDLAPKYGERFFTEVPPLIAAGKIKAKEHVVHGLDQADKAWVQMFRSEHLGKTVVVVAEDD